VSSQNAILTNVLDKLDQLPIKFSITDTDIVPALEDTIRELGISDVSLITDLKTELYVELRTEYWMLHRLKNSQSLNFKYSTSVDGRSIDKTEIPKMIQETMDDLEVKFNTWRAESYNRLSGGSGGIWTRTSPTRTRLTTTS